MSLNVDKSRTIHAVSTAPYKISKNEQLIIVEFEPTRIHLQEEQLKGFQQKLEDGHTWMRINEDFKMQLRLARFMRFPQASGHTYYGCNVVFKAAPFDEIVFKRCGTFEKPQP
ncbi:hypothetical protein Tco_1407521 [Tanacetum coccineum]